MLASFTSYEAAASKSVAGLEDANTARLGPGPRRNFPVVSACSLRASRRVFELQVTIVVESVHARAGF
jgi:hypothetical protein